MMRDSNDGSHPERWLVVDTDAGIDDAVALCMALKLDVRHGLTCKLVTTTHGNCSLDNVNQNVAKCVRACGLDHSSAPRVVAGAARPLLGGEPTNSSYFHGEDGLGDAGLPEADNCLSEGSASEELVALCKEAASKHAQVTCVALGPLTNIALALRQEPSLPQLLHRMIFMGGCGNARGNKTRLAEFNVEADPEAAAEVFAASWPRMEVVSWELTGAVFVPWATFDRLLDRRGSPVACFLRDILHKSYWERRAHSHAHQQIPGAPATQSASGISCCMEPVWRLLCGAQSPQGGAIICDAVAMALALSPDVSKRCAHVHVDVELQGSMTRGQTVLDWGHCFDGIQRQKDVSWVMEIDSRCYIELLRQMLQ